MYRVWRPTYKCHWTAPDHIEFQTFSGVIPPWLVAVPPDPIRDWEGENVATLDMSDVSAILCSVLVFVNTGRR